MLDLLDVLKNTADVKIQHRFNHVESEDSDDSLKESGADEFPVAVHLGDKIFNKQEYVTNISATNATDPKVVISISDGTLVLLSLTGNSFCDSHEFKNTNSDYLVEPKFDRSNENLLWVGYHNGIINLWDLRTNKPVSTFTDTTDDKVNKDKKFNSFDISACGRLLCAGTNKFEEDSFILFWDIRNCKLAGGFWESHMDDITQVKCHPNDKNRMFSASTDGLINIYDLSRSSEDDALIDTLNTESSIEKINITQQGSGDVVGCITHTADIQFWKSEDVKPYLSLSRQELTKLTKKKNQSNTYVVDILPSQAGSVIITGNKQRINGFKLEKKTLKPYFRLPENKQRVRCSWYNENINLLLTGGEEGQINAYKI